LPSFRALLLLDGLSTVAGLQKNNPYILLSDSTDNRKVHLLFYRKEFFLMPHTTDNDKKAKDNNALRHEKNMMREKNRQAGKNQFSKKTDHK
jgi:hypothetical protein